MEEQNIEIFLKTLKGADFFVEHIFKNGGCFQLYLILSTIYPQTVAYTNGNHVITWCCDNFWDIDGVVKDHIGYHIMNADEMRNAMQWSFAKNNDLYYGECPVCGEPVRIDRNKLILR